MQRSYKENVEEIVIRKFDPPAPPSESFHPFDASINDTIIQCPFGASDLAAAAMLKGFYEYFLKEIGEHEHFDPVFLKQIEENLLEIKKNKEYLAKRTAPNEAPPVEKSSLILPGANGLILP